MLASVSVALESSRGQSNTLEFDDPYEGLATFSCSQNDATAKRTCRKTCELGLKTQAANRGQFSRDGSAVWRPFGHRFRCLIVPVGMKMASEEPGDSGGRLGSVSGASWERLGSSRTALGTAGRQNLKPPCTTVYQSRLVTRQGRGGSCCAKCIHLTESDESCTRFDTPARGRRILLRTPAASHRRPLDFIELWPDLP